MNKGWARVTMGDVAHLEIERAAVHPARSYKLAGVYSFGRGLFAREDLIGSKTSYKFLHVLRPERFVMSKLKAWEGAVAVVPPGFDGFVLSPEFPTYRLNLALIIPEFLRLLTTWESFWERLAGESRGIGGRRERVHQDRLLEIPIDLPSLDEQRRIVDLVTAADEAAEASRNEQKAALKVAQTLRREGLAGMPSVALSELLTSIEAGKSPSGEDRVPGPNELAVLKVSAVRRGWFDPSQVKVITNSDNFPPHAELRDGDLLITRANTKELVGLVCRVDRAPSGRFLCDKTLRLNPRMELVSHDYLLEALLSDLVRNQIEQAATGTSGSMKNISQASLRNLKVPLMPRDRQDEWTGSLAEARKIAELAEREGAQLSVLRTVLTSDLLAGTRGIPDSYDALLESA